MFKPKYILEKAICFYNVTGMGIEYAVGKDDIEAMAYNERTGILAVAYNEGTRKLVKPLVIEVFYRRQ